MVRIRGLIVRQPYASMLARGEKRWEIRRYSTRVRGPVALVSRGLLYGFAELIDVFSASIELLSKYPHMHRVSREELEEYAAGLDVLYVWVFSNPLPLPKPVKVSYARGAQVWAFLDMREVLNTLEREGLVREASKVIKLFRKASRWRRWR